MTFLIHHKTERIAGGVVFAKCLWCENDMRGEVFELHQRADLFFFIPLVNSRTTYVQCQGCGKRMVAKCSADELVRSHATEVQSLLRKDVSVVGIALIIIGAIFCLFPGLGLVPTGIGYLFGRRYGGWPRKISAV